MTDRANVALRRCPDCGAELLGMPGVSWLACGGCPLALDPFARPVERMTTHRPLGQEGSTGPRLPFYVFETGGDDPAWIWIPAFRAPCPGDRSSDPGLLLAERGHRPPLVPAPLGAGLGRTPAEALVLARLRRGDLRGPRLLSLRCKDHALGVTEPVTGFGWPPGAIRPWRRP